MLIGAHVPTADLATPGAGRGADAVQIFLSAPRQYRSPSSRKVAEVAAQEHPALWVHAPYLINVCSARPDVVERSVAALQSQLDAAAAIGARGVIVHAGQAGKERTVDDAIKDWVSAIERLSTPVPLLIENTAGGSSAPGRFVDGMARLFASLERFDDRSIGFCLDTCHSHAGEGIDDGYAERLLAAVGGVELVHVNGSHDAAASGRDRHANLDDGQLPLEDIVDLITAVSAPAAVVETPGEAEQHAADIAMLRAALA